MNKIVRNHLTPAVIVFILVLFVLIPPALTRPQFVDEQFYSWGGAYFWDRLARLDFDPRPGPDPRTDPGWNPYDWWFVSSPQGFRLLYAAVMTTARVRPPTRAFVWEQRNQPQPQADIPDDTLLILRLFSVFCASIGLSVPAFRFGWLGLLVPFVFLVSPGLLLAPAHAMAEGPLLLGLGLCVLAYGSRWLGLACAFAASCKLTALGFWPAMLVPGACGAGRYARWLVPISALMAWVAVNPGSWLAGGPLYLITEIAFRRAEEARLSVQQLGILGFYMPPWYPTAFQYGFALLLVILLPRSNVIRRLLDRGGSGRIIDPLPPKPISDD